MTFLKPSIEVTSFQSTKNDQYDGEGNALINDVKVYTDHPKLTQGLNIVLEWIRLFCSVQRNYGKIRYFSL